MIVAFLEDPDSIYKVSAAADHFQWPVVFLRAANLAAGWNPLPSEARLLVLDLDLAGAGGLDSCRAVRAASPLPLATSGNEETPAAAAAALRAGADCYIPKPIDLDLFTAQVEALLRRASLRPARDETVVIRGLAVDLGRKEVRLHGNPVPVTPAEFRLLACLAARPGRAVSSSDLMKEIGGYDCSPAEAQEIVKVHVSRLRSKIDADPLEPNYLINVRGFGYMIERRGLRQNDANKEDGEEVRESLQTSD